MTTMTKEDKAIEIASKFMASVNYQSIMNIYGEYKVIAGIHKGYGIVRSKAGDESVRTLEEIEKRNRETREEQKLMLEEYLIRFLFLTGYSTMVGLHILEKTFKQVEGLYITMEEAVHTIQTVLIAQFNSKPEYTYKVTIDEVKQFEQDMFTMKKNGLWSYS
jgi:hypothetical protein